jgi:hypothetical protein
VVSSQAYNIDFAHWLLREIYPIGKGIDPEEFGAEAEPRPELRTNLPQSIPSLIAFT